MTKTAFCGGSARGSNRHITKTLLVMKLTVFLLTGACLNVTAKGVSQNVTFSGKEVALEKAFTEIEKQTGYLVLYSQAKLAKSKAVSIEAKDMPLLQFLEVLFKDQPFKYTIESKTIIISPSEEKNTPPAVAASSDRQRLSPPPPIRGRVLDQNGQPLPGASVSVKGGSSGVTDAEGVFTLNAKAGQTLTISYVGFETKEIKITTAIAASSDRQLTINLSPTLSELDQVTIQAYGTTTQRLSTGNIATVKAKDIEKQPVNNPLLALQGRVPGLNITQANGFPGSGLTVRIQGQNSIRNGNSPLYVVDGVPYPYQLPGNALSSINGSSGETTNGIQTGQGNALSFINPADIESIVILKDADATAIYGSRAANGAILITTKRGKAGKLTLDVNLQQGWGKVTRKMQMLNTPQYLEMRREAFKNDGLTPTVDNAPDLLLWDTTRYTDWQKVLIGNTAHFTNAQLGISGGTETVQYLLRGTYQREGSVLPGDFVDNRGGMHFNINGTSLDKKFNFQLSGSYLVDNNQLPTVDLTRQTIGLEPNAPALYNADGTLNWAPNTSGISTWPNPLGPLFNTYSSKTSNLISSINFSYQIITGLKIKANLGYNSLRNNELQLNPLIANQPEFRPFLQRSAGYLNRSTSSWIIEPQLIYDRQIKKGNLGFLVGTTIQQSFTNRSAIFGSDYNSDLVLEDMHSAVTLSSGTVLATIYKYTASYSRLNYNWRDKYIINLTGRRDGSSRFGARDQFSNFGAVGAAWIFSEENLFKRNLAFLSFGKLRGSYGTTGSDQINDYSFLNLYGNVYASVPYQGIVGIVPNALPNPYLKWEATRKLQLGLDLGFINDRILLNTTYARNRSSNQLLNYVLPTITGKRSVLQNFPATIQNVNWEFSLNTINIKNEWFNWSTAVNLTVPRNKLIAFPGLENSSYASLLIIGQPISISKYLHYAGVDPTTGIYTIIDANGKPTTNPSYPADLISIYSPFPKYYGGLQNSFSYNSLQLDIFFQFTKQKGPNSLFASTLGPSPGQFQPGSSNQPVTVLNRWKAPGDHAVVQSFSTEYPPSFYNAIGSDATYSDASYIRLKNISLSWQLPADWLKKVHMQYAKVYVQGQNLLTITHYKGLDPETLSVATLPPLRMLAAGLQIGL
jgi:TonB-linked SusC/RagA family outer membrane protein